MSRDRIYDPALGVRRTQLDAVDGAAVTVETPPSHAAEQIDVSAYAYDDEPGDVELEIGSDIRIGVTLSPAAARQLSERLVAAADEADTEIDE